MLSLREDYLAQLAPYARLLPDGFRARYRLDRLGPAAALRAIREPARVGVCPFADGVAEQLVEDLRKVRLDTEHGPREIVDEFVEPVQLQVTARTLWQALPESATEITQQHRQRFGDVDDVLREFYDDAIAATTTVARISEDSLRARFASTFITPMRTRGTVIWTPAGAGGIPPRAIEELDARHLIRAEHRAGARWYELTHDRLIEPIRVSNRDRDRRRRERRQRRALIGVGVLAALVAAAVTAAFAHGSHPPATAKKAGPGIEGVPIPPVQPLARGPVRVGRINSVSFAQGGTKVLVVGDLRGRLLAADDLQPLKVLPATEPDGQQRLAVVDRQGVRLQAFLPRRSVRGGRVTLSDRERPLIDEGFDGPRPVSIAFSRHARYAAVLDTSGRVSLFDMRTNRRFAYPPPKVGAYATPALGGDWVFFAGSNGIRRGSATHAHLDTPRKLASVPAAGVAVAGDGALLAAYGDGSQIRLLDAGGRLVGRLPGTNVVAADFSPSGDRLAVAHGDGTVDIWPTRPELVLEHPRLTSRGSEWIILAAVHNVGASRSSPAAVQVGTKRQVVHALDPDQSAPVSVQIRALPPGIPALVRIRWSASRSNGRRAAEWRNGHYVQVATTAGLYVWPKNDKRAQIVAAALTAASRGREIQDKPIQQLQAFAGVLHGVKLPDVPQTANSVMFATWCYFQAHVPDPNGIGYKTAYLSTTFDSTGLQSQGQPATSTRQPGDLVFYNGDAPVAVYVGGEKVVRWMKLPGHDLSLHPAVAPLGLAQGGVKIRRYLGRGDK